ncbi:MAG: cytochrome-c oxidase, cbb3-type subunit I [Planctomycetota bacterium]
MNERLESFRYDDSIVRKFLFATILWGIVGMLVGIVIALQLAEPSANTSLRWLAFGRLRPLHTNAVIFAFAGNAIFTGIYYSLQRLLKTRIFSDTLSRIHFWGWQAIIVAAAITLPLGYTQSKEYAELEWPIDIAIAVVWVVFAVNLFGTIARRRERHLYVAIWFYIATVVTIAILHIFNNIVVVAGALRSYPIYAGVQDAFMQWWYGHNAVAFFLTTPFLGIMYYFMPKAANRPVFSYRLSILHFWTIVFLYIWAGPHHLHYTALPAWASTLGMIFSVMLWMPSWGGMVNGLLTLRGAWHKVAEDPILKFFVVAVTFYGMSTFEGPMLSVKTVNALSHYTDWTIAHVHGGGLGWVGFLSFGMIYWLLPRLFQTPTWSSKLVEWHFWIGTLGILLYITPIYVAGITQGLMWFAFEGDGTLSYEFVETTQELKVLYWARALGGILYFGGALLCGLNVVRTWLARPRAYEEPELQAPALEVDYVDPPAPVSALQTSGAHVAGVAYKLERFLVAAWHRRWERLPVTFTVMVTVAVVAASLFEIIPTFLIRSNVPTISSVRPYTPLELGGRDLYISNGCYNCHSQMIRPIWAETRRYGEYSKPGEFVYDHPFQWGSRRIGPDLAREGGKRPHVWHVLHMQKPEETVQQSIMPSYAWMLDAPFDFDGLRSSVRAMAHLGVPYDERTIVEAPALARAQARRIAGEIVEQGGQPGLGDRQIVAIIAYLQRLGTDIEKGTAAANGAPSKGGE